MARRLRHLIADPEEQPSIGTSLRAKRWELFHRRFPDIERMRVLDLGGVVQHWRNCPVKPASVVVVNLLPEAGDDRITAVQGDACNPPPAVQNAKFDLVYSNSTIEHVGGHARRCDFADVIHAMAPYHWIQTPYRYFPIEPHWLFPGLQFLPQCTRAWAIRHWPLSPARPNPEQALRDVLEVDLLSTTQMQYHFPRSEVVRERVLGLTKSLIAVASG
jgi:hypothetical protein